MRQLPILTFALAKKGIIRRGKEFSLHCPLRLLSPAFFPSVGCATRHQRTCHPRPRHTFPLFLVMHLCAARNRKVLINRSLASVRVQGRGREPFLGVQGDERGYFLLRSFRRWSRREASDRGRWTYVLHYQWCICNCMHAQLYA